MSIDGGPDIIKDGLVLCLDAGNRNSYNSGSNTWFDLSINGNNGTLTNGPTFSSANGGSIVFDGTNDQINCGNALSLQITIGTISAWFNATNANSGYNGIITKRHAWSLFVQDNVLMTFDWGSGAVPRSTGITVGNGLWNHAAMSFNTNIDNGAIVYLNGVAVLTTRIIHYNHAYGVRIGESSDANQFLTGNVACASVYNRRLSATEIQQNYNANKGRFGL
jgi:hypothetical protein